MPLPVKTAFVLGAGLGTRLRPLTNDWPKPLLMVQGLPLITHAFEHLHRAGVNRILINTHHCSPRYKEVFPEGSWKGIPLIFRHEPVLLETGGGLKNMEDLVGEETFLVYNGDVFTSLPLEPLLKAHRASGCEVTLALRSKGSSLNVGLDERGRVQDLRGRLGTQGLTATVFTGIYVVEPRFLKRLTAGKIESVVEAFLRMIVDAPDSLGGVVIDDGFWFDLGTMEEFQRVRTRELASHE